MRKHLPLSGPWMTLFNIILVDIKIFSTCTGIIFNTFHTRPSLLDIIILSTAGEIKKHTRDGKMSEKNENKIIEEYKEEIKKILEEITDTEQIRGFYVWMTAMTKNKI